MAQQEENWLAGNGVELVLLQRGQTGFSMVLNGCVLAADAAAMMSWWPSAGGTGACTFACGHPAGAAVGAVGYDFFKAELLGQGRPEPALPAGSRPFKVFFQRRLQGPFILRCWLRA